MQIRPTDTHRGDPQQYFASRRLWNRLRMRAQISTTVQAQDIHIIRHNPLTSTEIILIFEKLYRPLFTNITSR
jgi:hypothetical protein